MTELSGSNWIEFVTGWRARVASAPVPFVTGPLGDNAFFLFTELVELAEEIFKNDESKPNYARRNRAGKIANEIGDAMLMLGTVAHQCGWTMILPPELSPPPVPESPFRFAFASALISADIVAETESDEAQPDSPISAISSLPAIFYSLLKIADHYGVNPYDCMLLSMQEIEETRCGL